MKMFKVIGIFLLISYIVFSWYRFVELRTEIVNLKTSLEIERTEKDNLYGYIQELSFIMEKAHLQKKDVYKAIQDFTDMRHKELDKDGLEYTSTPREYNEKARLIYGYHTELEFRFDETGKVKKIVYPKFEPHSFRIN